VKSSIPRQAVILALLALLPAASEAIYFRDKISWRSAISPSEMVTVEQAREWGDTAIWIDARPDDEFANNHVPGAILLNEDRWNELLPQFLAVWSPGKKVVVYCSSLSCNASREVAQRLRKEAQLSDVFVLEGGWEAWLKKKR
jgi:rhodanese-related sulfurtransferase